MKSRIWEYICLNEKSLSEVIYKLLQGLNLMHTKGIIHRDIKLENLQLRNDNNFTDIYLTGFQFVEFFDGQKMHFQRKAGTIGYFAPETLKERIHSPKTDIYSLGVVFFFLLL